MGHGCCLCCAHCSASSRESHSYVGGGGGHTVEPILTRWLELLSRPHAAVDSAAALIAHVSVAAQTLLPVPRRCCWLPSTSAGAGPKAVRWCHGDVAPEVVRARDAIAA